MEQDNKKRCAWVNTKNPLYVQYHDYEWGVPLHDDQELFELLVLEMMQAGLSWETILNKREYFRQAFDGFNPRKVAQYDDSKISELLSNRNIIRNRKKILAAINNARIFTQIQDSYGSFDNYIWSFVHFKPIDNKIKSSKQLPATSPLAQKISKDLKHHGMTFVGPVIIYSYLQAIGIVNDHEVTCFRHSQILELYPD